LKADRRENDLTDCSVLPQGATSFGIRSF